MKKALIILLSVVLVSSVFAFAACDIDLNPTEDLTEYRNAAIAQLHSFVEELDRSDYTPVNWGRIEGYVTEGKAGINAAVNRAGVRTARDTVKERIGKVEQLGEWTGEFEYHSFIMARNTDLIYELGEILKIKGVSCVELYLDYFTEEDDSYINGNRESLRSNYTDDFFDTHYLIIIHFARGSACSFSVVNIIADGVIYINEISGPLPNSVLHSIVIELPRSFMPDLVQVEKIEEWTGEFEYRSFVMSRNDQILDNLEVLTKITSVSCLDSYLDKFQDFTKFPFGEFISEYIEFMQDNYTADFFSTHYLVVVQVLCGSGDGTYDIEITKDGVLYITEPTGLVGHPEHWSIIIELPRTFRPNTIQGNFNRIAVHREPNIIQTNFQ